MKKIISIFALLLISSFAFANKVKIKIKNVKVNEGKVVLSINYSKESFKNHSADKTIILETSSAEIETVLELPYGEFAFSIYQDLNNDNKLNSNLIGIPKEPFSFSNYNGKSVPGNFEKHKVTINQDCELVIELFTM
ncbi:MAG: DUF2141 domain-containing protein [Treponema sp.]|nr:DUF2141 domain-containing protein [Treponema sp.]